MLQQFVDRERELEFLEERYAEGKPNLIIIYGRRRVGKTELVKQFLQGKRGAYILCTRDSVQENAKELKDKFRELTGKTYFSGLETASFLEIFKLLADEIKGEQVIVIIDEFPYLIELDGGIVSVLQKVWDEVLAKTRVFLILSGSSVGMMETEALGHRSPLYGRRTGEWKVEPFSFSTIASSFKGLPREGLVKVWSVFGGTPFYLSKIDERASIEENIKRRIFRKGEILYNEPRFLLSEEFREPRTYTNVLKYLSLGYCSHGELSQATGIEKGNLSKYLSVLEETRLVRYILPLGRRKRGIYMIDDPFFNFWFRFVYPNMSDLEIGLVDEVFAKIAPQLNQHYGRMFERLVMHIMNAREIELPFQFTETGSWWHKDKEIDIIARNGETKQILFAECKWQDGVDAASVVDLLREKASYFSWRDGERREYYAVFAKSFKEGAKERAKGALLFDLRDLAPKTD